MFSTSRPEQDPGRQSQEPGQRSRPATFPQEASPNNRREGLIDALPPAGISSADTPIALHATSPPAGSLHAPAQPRSGVTRLDSLSRRSGPGTSAPKVLKIQPRAPARRSQQEREQAEREEQRRIVARSATTDAVGSSTRGPFGDGRAGYRGRGWFRGRGYLGARGGIRGGFGMGMPLPERVGEGMASGPFGAGSVMTEKKKLLASGIKREAAANAANAAGSRSTRQSGGPSRKGGKKCDASERDRHPLKHETSDVRYASSTDEGEGEEAPRVDVEFINLISDDEHNEDGNKGDQERSPSRPKRGLKPIHLDTREHVDRVVGVGSESTSRQLAEQRRWAKERGDDDDLFVPRDYELEKGRRKAKERSKDVEFLRDGRKWKGVYQDEEEQQVRVKQEPPDEPESVMIENLPSASNLVEPSVGDDAGSKDVQTDDVKKGKGKPKPKAGSRAHLTLAKPILQTAEDGEEWARHEQDVRLLSAELGHLPLASDIVQPGVDAEGDVDMPPPDLHQPDHKWGRLYLFQFPPILPPLHNPKEVEVPAAEPKKIHLEPGSTPITKPTALETPSKTSANVPPASATDAKIVANVTDASHPSKVPTRSSNTVKFPRGKSGKLTVHASGRVVLSWGGTSLEVHRGTEVEFLQNVVLAEVTEDDDMFELGGGAKADGKACGLGTVAGKFVLTPDWGELFR